MNNIIINERLEEFNAKKKKLEVIPRYNILILSGQGMYIQQKLVKSTLKLDDGFILSNQTSKDYISGYNIDKHVLENSGFKNTAGIIEIAL